MTDMTLTRREALKLAIAAASASALSAPLFAQSAIHRKPIPSSGEEIPVIGVGTNSFNLSLQEQLTEVIEVMVDAGGSVIDTAAGYGESEETIGRIVAATGLRKQLFISTKFAAGGGFGGPPPGAAGPGAAGQATGPGAGNAPAGAGPGQGGGMPAGGPPMMNMLWGEESFERSLERLQTDHLDLLMVHNLNGTDELVPKMVDWKKAGRIRYLGVTTSNERDHAAMIEAMEKHPLDFVQVNYSLGDRAAEEQVLPLAQKRGIAVMVNVPFGGRGARTLSRVLDKPVPAWADDIGATSWAQAFLKFVVSHPAVTVAIPGTTKASHMLDNQKAALGPMPDSGLRERMAADFDKLAEA